MPILGLTDRGLAFPEIGKIRLGEKAKTADGKEYPRDLDYFRVEFDESDDLARQVFMSAHADTSGKPNSLTVYLPYNEMERDWDAWLEAYTASRLVARSDGRWVTYWVNSKNGKVLVRNGEATEKLSFPRLIVNEKGEQVEDGKIEAEEGSSVPYVKGMVMGLDYQGKPITCKVVGRLKVILPELGRAGYLTMTTGSMINVASLGGSYIDDAGHLAYSGEIGVIKTLADSVNGGRLQGIPMRLYRRKQVIHYREKGQQKKTTKALLHIEADPDWFQAALIRVHELASPVAALAASTTVNPDVPIVIESEEELVEPIHENHDDQIDPDRMWPPQAEQPEDDGEESFQERLI